MKTIHVTKEKDNIAFTRRDIGLNSSANVMMEASVFRGVTSLREYNTFSK